MIKPSEPSSDRLALLYQLSQTFNSSLDLDEVLNRVMDEVIAAVHAERGFVMLAEVDGELVFRVARGIDQKTIEDPQFQISRSVVESVARKEKPILTSDAQSDSRFNIRESVVFLGLRSILCVPLKYKERVSGVIYVDNSLQVGIFAEEDLELLNAIASSAAVAIENARLYEVAVEKGRLERELQLAHKVQESLLPGETPQIPGWEFAAIWQPAREVAGDYYDFIPGSRDNLGLVIADVTDKGMPAALYMAFTRSIIRASVDLAPTPVAGITHANQLICDESTYGFFVTLFFASLDVKSGEITYVNAGHNPPLHFHASENKLYKLVRTGIPVGIESNSSYEQRSITLNSGDFILLYTDGVTDSVNAQMEEFGNERFERVVLDQRLESAADILAAITQSVDDFTSSTAPFDDITIVVAKRR